LILRAQLLLLMCSLSFVCQAQTWPRHMEVFTNQPGRVHGQNSLSKSTRITIYDMQASNRFDASLTPALSSDPKAARRQAQQYLKKLDQKSLQTKARKAYQGALKAAQYNVKKVPAIVFNNGESVIFGVLDLKRALHIWREKK